MEGFTDHVPFTIAVTWAKNVDGSPTEYPLLNAKPFSYGVLAEENFSSPGQVTRWFIPWTSVVYVKQVQPLVPPAAPLVPGAPPPVVVKDRAP